VLLPGHRLIERLDALHLVEARRVVSINAPDALRTAIKQIAAQRDLGSALRRSELDEATAGALLELLAELGVLDEADQLPAESSAVTLRAADFIRVSVPDAPSPREIGRRLAATTVHVINADGAASPDQPPREFLDVAEEAGLRTESTTTIEALARLDPATDVVAALNAGLGSATTSRINELCIASGVAWLAVGSFDGAVARVGPLVIPGQSACHECLVARTASNVEFADRFRDLIPELPAVPVPAAMTAWARSVAVLILLRWVGAADPNLPGRLFVLAADSLTGRAAAVHRVPRCRGCGHNDQRPAASPWETL
jgi:bacteriocin biosynthesis cyclodehydratase domain-containing protein